MKIAVAINGSLVAENTAFLALKYAKKLSIDLLLFHVENEKDKIEDVNLSVEEIKKHAKREGVLCEMTILKTNSDKSISSYFKTLHIDTLFCSTRMRSSFLTNSFSERLLRLKLKTDIAVVRIVKMHSLKNLDAIMVPIKQSKLSVKKFTFFSTLVCAYNSSGKIYSISPTSKNELSHITLTALKERLAHINFELRHYAKLSKLLSYDLQIKHDFSNDETRSILTHIAESAPQLVVVGAKRFSFGSIFKGEKPIERLLRETSENLIAYYPKED